MTEDKASGVAATLLCIVVIVLVCGCLAGCSGTITYSYSIPPKTVVDYFFKDKK